MAEPIDSPDETDRIPYSEQNRKPARHKDRDIARTARPMVDLRPARGDPKLLNRLTGNSTRATGQENRAVKQYPDILPQSERSKPSPVEELLQGIDEEESNRLNRFDGYVKPPTRPRAGFGLKLRSQHDDINEYFTGPKWHDDRPSVESAESRGLTPPIGPWIVRNAGPKWQYREQGEKVRRAEPPPASQLHPPPPPPPSVPPPKSAIFTAHKIRFKEMDLLDMELNHPADIVGPDSLNEITEVAKFLVENPTKLVEIRASVGLVGAAKYFPSLIKYAIEKRGEAVSKRLQTQGVDAKRIRIGVGTVGTGPEHWIVEFEFDPIP